MNAVEIEEAISGLAREPFDAGEFPFSFLEAFGNKATSIKRLRSGTTNKSDIGGVLQTNNIHIKVCESGEVAKLAGFGAKSVEKILSGIKNREAYSRRHLWWKANETAGPILEGLRGLSQVERAESAGSLRRKMETVGDLDFIAASNDPGPIMDWFVALPDVAEVTGHGSTKSSLRFESGMQADLRVVPPEQFVFALHHFTGSKDHNVAMRSRALSKGYSLSEWGLRTDDKEEIAVATIEDESELFKLLDLNYITPELREGRGEIEAAEDGELPKLVESLLRVRTAMR